jgi:hypothetical protein
MGVTFGFATSVGMILRCHEMFRPSTQAFDIAEPSSEYDKNPVDMPGTDFIMH